MTRSWDALADELMSQLKLSLEPPVDLDALANSFGISSIEDAPLVEDGRLEHTSTGTRIFIREGTSGARRRFTIAHELAHLLLIESSEQGVFRRSTDSEDAIERLCDSLAAAILMPRNWMTRFVDRPHNLSTMRSVSHHAQVSYSAAVARLRSAVRWNEGLLRFQFHEGRWRFIAGSGVPAILFGRLRSSPQTSDVLEETKRKTSRDRNVTLPMRVDDSEFKVDAQASVRRDRAFVLANLNYLVRIADGAGVLRAQM